MPLPLPPPRGTTHPHLISVLFLQTAESDSRRGLLVLKVSLVCQDAGVQSSAISKGSFQRPLDQGSALSPVERGSNNQTALASFTAAKVKCSPVKGGDPSGGPKRARDSSWRRRRAARAAAAAAMADARAHLMHLPTSHLRKQALNVMPSDGLWSTSVETMLNPVFMNAYSHILKSCNIAHECPAYVNKGDPKSSDIVVWSTAGMITHDSGGPTQGGDQVAMVVSDGRGSMPFGAPVPQWQATPRGPASRCPHCGAAAVATRVLGECFVTTVTSLTPHKPFRLVIEATMESDCLAVCSAQETYISTLATIVRSSGSIADQLVEAWLPSRS